VVKLSDNDPVLRFPYRGAPQTVAVMKRAALEQHYPVRLLAERVCGGIGTKDYLSEMQALYSFVCNRTRYMRDPRTIELVRSPMVVTKQLLAGHTPCLDCDDQAAFLAALLLMTGAQVRFMTVAFQNAFYQGQRQYSHVLLQAMEPRSSTWITLDPVAGDKTPEMLSRVKAAAFWPVA
jgi:hypothetical protein